LSLLGRLAPNDLERLSAYVDGALTPRERSTMDARLEADADLRQALAELRSVKASLAGLPEYRLPRSFILRDADVRRRTPRAAFPALRFATIIASGLFVLTTAIRWLPSSGMALAFRSAPPAAAELQAEFGAAATETGLELRAEAPAAAPEEGLMDSLMAAPTPTADATACPTCPTALTTAKVDDAPELGQSIDTADHEAGDIAPLSAAQWLLGLAALGLGALTLRARRG
jgi:hypothetical protein